jgi:hypothetical protein
MMNGQGQVVELPGKRLCEVFIGTSGIVLLMIED